MFDEYTYHYDKYDKIEEYDDKDGCQEGTKKCCCVGKEAAGGRNVNKSHPLLSIAASAPYVLMLCIYCTVHSVTYNPRPLFSGVGL